MSNGQPLALEFAAMTDIGCRRTRNEDSYGYDSSRRLYAVCDGMGGMAAGEVASATAVRTLMESFENAASGQPVEEKLFAGIAAANRAVLDAARASRRLEGMGTTLVCACLDGERLAIGNVGDSRAYLVRAGKSIQVTRDHSFVAEQVRQGLMTAEMAAASNLQSILTRAVGVAEVVEPDLFAIEIEAGDRVLLASDGLTRLVNREEIGYAMGADAPLDRICGDLIGRAKERGGLDNITCIALRAVPAVAPGFPRWSESARECQNRFL